MNINQISLNNLFQHDFNALSFSLLGMALVFCGLVVISLCITILPMVLNWFVNQKNDKVRKGNNLKSEIDKIFTEKERLIAIAVAYHLEINSRDENQKITWKSRPNVESAWQISGRMHNLTKHNSLIQDSRIKS